MQVIKRNGAVQEFVPGKIKASIAAVSDDLREPMTEADLDYITRNVCDSLLKIRPDNFSYIEIHYTVVSTLKAEGFGEIAEAFNNSDRSFMNK